jgi:hypothetical protein
MMSIGRMRGAKKLSSRSINGHTFATTPSANRDIVRRIGAGLATSPVAQVSGQTADNLFSCCLTSTTTDCISSPPWTLFAKNLNKSALRRNSFSQFGVKPGLPLDSLGCGPASFALPASFVFPALFALWTTGAFPPRRHVAYSR